MASAMPYVVGQWVRGDKFYGRAKHIDEIRHGPRNLLWLLGTRRLGKTSLLRQVEHVTSGSGSGYFPLYWDFQGADDVSELQETFADALFDSEERLTEIGLSLKEIESDTLFSSLNRIRRCLRSTGLRLLLLCDEVEQLITLHQAEPSLLSKLRRALQSPDDVRSVLASTIRLWELSEQKEDTSPFLHGFAPPLYIGTLADQEARELICQTHLGRQGLRAFDDETVETIRERCDNHPYLIQLVCKRYLETRRLDEAVEQVAADSMVSYFFSVDFEMLPRGDRVILQVLVDSSASNSDSIREYLGVEDDTLRRSLARLENLAFIRRNDAGNFVLVNYFFRHWLREIHTDRQELAETSLTKDPAGPSVESTESHDLNLGVIDNRYELQRKVGEGASGVVYQAYDRMLGVKIAVKVLRARYADNAGALERFRQEVLLSRDIAHPNILRTYDLGDFRGRAFLTMQWVKGTTLAQKIAEESPVPLGVCLTVAKKLASALEAAHAHKVLHRDIKPHNVMLDHNGEPFLTDFGVARLLGQPGMTRSGVFLGTPSYASPEQADLLPLDERSDIYGMGVVLFELITGRRPFESDDGYDVLEMHRSAKSPRPEDLRPGIPAELSHLLLSCLEKQPAERCQSATILRAGLETLAADS